VDQRLKDLVAGAYLEQKEGREYIQLLAKAMPTPDEQTRIKQLRELSESRGKRLQELVGKNPLDEMEKKELGDLTGRQRNMEAILPRIQEDLEADARSRVEAVRRELFNQLRTSVAEVAKEKGVTQVFSSEALVYAATDLTPQVLQKLKK
jgi:Skp family chaperone for outer membrane proteins